jgi:hypothetical protein
LDGDEKGTCEDEMLEGMEAGDDCFEGGVEETATEGELEGGEIGGDVGYLFEFVGIETGTIVKTEFREIGLEE